MGRNSFSCSRCVSDLGKVNMPSGTFHPGAGVRVVFIDRDADVVTIACPVCGEYINLRARRFKMA